MVTPFVPSVPPTFDATMRQFFRDFANSFTEYGSVVGLKAAARNPDGTLIRDRYGNVSYADPVDYHVLVQWKSETVGTASGAQLVVDGTVTFSWPPPTIYTEDKLVIDGMEFPVTGVSFDPSTDPMSPTRAFI